MVMSCLIMALIACHKSQVPRLSESSLVVFQECGVGRESVTRSQVELSGESWKPKHDFHMNLSHLTSWRTDNILLICIWISRFVARVMLQRMKETKGNKSLQNLIGTQILDVWSEQASQKFHNTIQCIERWKKTRVLAAYCNIQTKYKCRSILCF